ncbi:phytyl ester synthase 1, chloroplastic-like isoform X2 [Rutidosis leptorrhynchoides]|uniref:phytyl ester synthase 1, chloroplastic-like isoform X2 n=1 Tax=Rutidosis leptorrhynchoides TaxID=125765 RepID=UPI003A98EF1A
MDLIKSDGGPPRWFCPVSCGKPLSDSPVLLYLPGIDGTGAGLVVHEKALGKVFHVQCLHIPVWDRTPLKGLIEFVEETVRIEHTLSPNKPIYILGESFGGALALSVAARNPTIDLILVLANPATSYQRSYLHAINGIVNLRPNELYGIKRFLMTNLMGDYLKMEIVGMDGPNDSPSFLQLFRRCVEDLPLFHLMLNIFPKETLEWRLKLAELAADYANSRLFAITAQLLILASGKDMFLPSINEAHRLSRIIKRCKIRVFEDNGHTILLESGVQLLSTIKTTHTYRRFSKHDHVEDFLPPSITEFKKTPMETWCYRLFTGATMFSTMEDGKIVRGLEGIPDEGPVLIVSNRTLRGFEIISFALEFLREKGVVVHALTHPETVPFNFEDDYIMKLFGAISISAKNLLKLLLRKSYILLYPGGARDIFHRKGSPQELLRMSVKYGATIIPFVVVGEDEISEMVNEFNQGKTNLRKGMSEEISKQELHFPILLPKIHSRLYYLFAKPIKTKGNENILHDKDYLQKLYSQINCDFEEHTNYLLKKREEDPYRGLVERFFWLMTYGSLDQIPSFDQ